MKTLVIVVLVLVLAGAIFAVWRKPAIAPHETGSASSPSASVPQGNIIVMSPKTGDRVGNPITVVGKARVFENTFSYILRSADGTKLLEDHAMTDAPDAGIFGNFTVAIPVPAGAPKDLIVEVFEYSAKDGSVTNLVRVPVIFTGR